MGKTIPTRGRHLNHVAWLYDPVMEKLSFGRERRFREKTLQHMDIAATDMVLDIGCGTGSLTLLVARRLEPPGRIIGIDAAPNMITIARRKARALECPATFQVGVAERLEFEDSAFDFVVNSMFTHHIDHELKKRAFQEMYRVLKPGGGMLTVDIDRPTTILGALTGWGARYMLFQEELVDNLQGKLPGLIAGAGFEDIVKREHVYGLVSFFSARKAGGCT